MASQTMDLAKQARTRSWKDKSAVVSGPSRPRTARTTDWVWSWGGINSGSVLLYRVMLYLYWFFASFAADHLRTLMFYLY